jgi:hypothetical protein
MRKRALFIVLLPLAAAIPLAGSSCGDGGGSSGAPSSSATGSGGAGTSTGTGGAGGSGGNDTIFDAGGCNNGDPCDGGVCAGNVCCPVDLACGGACCAGGQVCSFQQCVTPGGACADSDECAPDEYCELSLGEPSDAGAPDGGSCMGGAAPLSGKCLPKPPTCPDGQPAPQPGEPLTCLAECQYKPPSGQLSPVLKYAWGGELAAPYSTDIMMTPIVIQLDDDDCDGKVTAKDIPEIVFSTFSSGQYTSAGVLRAVSVQGGAALMKWSVEGVVNPTKQLAAGNIDGQPGNEIIACGVDGAVHAFTGAGLALWTSAPMTCLMPSIADLDGDGMPEVIAEGGILDGAKGTMKSPFSVPVASSLVVSDIDGDGKLDIVTSSQGYHADGTLFVDTGLAHMGNFYGTSDWKSPWPAVADIDKDGKPEIVVVDNLNHALSIWRYDAAQPGGFAVVRSPVDINGPLSPSLCPSGSWGNTHGGGPPTIADFNGDGTPDVAMAGGVGYAVFDGKKLMDPAAAGPDTFLWIKQTFDCSSASTGSTVFDFNGDGIAEVVYSDQRYLRVYEGPTGNVLWETCNTTATLIENPIIADVDNDGHADIVVVSNAYTNGNPTFQCNDGVSNSQSGVRIFGSSSGEWVRTRRVWNQHAYHVTNVAEDGSIPANELPNFAQPGLNNFRQQKQPGSEFSAPDAVVSLGPRCFGDYGLVATVRNIGEAALPSGVPVGFYAGTHPTGTWLGQGITSKVLYSAESEAIFLPLPNATPDVKNGTTPVYAVVDDGSEPHPAWTECRTDNNVSAAVTASCDQPN